MEEVKKEIEKNNQKIKLIILGIVLLLLCSIGAIIIYNTNKSNEIKKDNILVIENNYQDLTENIKEYNEIREEYIKLSEDFYYDTFMSKIDKYQELLDRYDLVINLIDEEVIMIEKRCDVIYDDSKINKICNSYKTIYEKLINLYVMDINNFNDKVIGFNEINEDKLEEREKIHKDYIDYNNDGEFEAVIEDEKD